MAESSEAQVEELEPEATAEVEADSGEQAVEDPADGSGEDFHAHAIKNPNNIWELGALDDPEPQAEADSEGAAGLEVQAANEDRDQAGDPEPEAEGETAGAAAAASGAGAEGEGGEGLSSAQARLMEQQAALIERLLAERGESAGGKDPTEPEPEPEAKETPDAGPDLEAMRRKLDDAIATDDMPGAMKAQRELMAAETAPAIRQIMQETISPILEENRAMREQLARFSPTMEAALAEARPAQERAEIKEALGMFGHGESLTEEQLESLRGELAPNLAALDKLAADRGLAALDKGQRAIAITRLALPSLKKVAGGQAQPAQPGQQGAQTDKPRAQSAPDSKRDKRGRFAAPTTRTMPRGTGVRPAAHTRFTGSESRANPNDIISLAALK